MLQVLALGSSVSAPPLLVSPREFGYGSPEDGMSNAGCVLLPWRSWVCLSGEHLNQNQARASQGLRVQAHLSGGAPG